MLWINKYYDDGRIEYRNENEMDTICFLNEGWTILDQEDQDRFNKLKASCIFIKEIDQTGKRIFEYCPEVCSMDLLC